MSTAAAAFAEAAALLTDRDIRLFERATSFSLQQLVEKVLALNGRELQGVLDLGLGEYGNLYPHALNSNGLHVLKWIIARRIVDSRRAANGWQKHPRYKEFMEKGLLSQKLKHWQPGRSGRVPLTFSELSLIGLASGFSYKHAPFVCARMADEAATSALPDVHTASSVAVEGHHDYVFRDSDDQYQLHVDVFMPNIKFMIFTEDVSIQRGPFHFVLGSHRITLSKAKWLFNRTRHLTAPKRTRDGAFRHVNISAWERGEQHELPQGLKWCTSSHACLEDVYEWQQRDLTNHGFPRPTPMIVEAGTMVVADTSAFHFRGIGQPGGRRARMANVIDRCGRKSKRLGFIVNVPRYPVLTCANGTAARIECRLLHS